MLLLVLLHVPQKIEKFRASGKSDCDQPPEAVVHLQRPVIELRFPSKLFIRLRQLLLHGLLRGHLHRHLYKHPFSFSIIITFNKLLYQIWSQLQQQHGQERPPSVKDQRHWFKAHRHWFKAHRK